MSEQEEPIGPASIVVMAMPRDTNQSGDVFGGWLLSHMDIAGAVAAVERAGGRVVTVAADTMVFHKPVFVGNVVSFHTTVVKTGRTSLQVRIEAWARRAEGHAERVTTGLFTYVRMGADRRPAPIGS